MKNKIYQLRRLKNMSIQELSDKSKVPRTVISQLETGARTTVTTGTLIKIANALDVKVEDLFYLTLCIRLWNNWNN